MKSSLLTLLLIPCFVLGQSKKDGFRLNFSAVAIPEELKKNAHSVYRLDEGIVDISAPGKYTYKVHQVLTILDKEGAHHLRQAQGIDKFEKVEDIEIRVFNELGIETTKYKKKDFSITAAYDGISLVTDDKVMGLVIPVSEFPVTLEIKYTREITSHINLENWYFQGYDDAVETSRFVIKTPTDVAIRYKTKDIKIEPVITTEGSRNQYVWEAKNLPAKKYEEGAGGYAHRPRILVGATKFEYDGYAGNMSDWKGLGTWYADLVKQTNQLSMKYKTEVQNLVAGVPDDAEKVRVLYGNLQKNFRYVSIALGIGGFKPFAADFVHEKKYGDCKALTNYMQACLNAVNIKSYAALINAGEEMAPVDPDFAYNGFNHVILCVPLNKDTVWLECTSRSVDFAHLGNFTENRNALLVTENGGVLVSTPKSYSHHNQFHVTTLVDLGESGAGKFESRLVASGEYKSTQFGYSQEKDDIKKQYFVSGLGFPNPDQLVMNFEERTTQPSRAAIQFSLEKAHDFSAGNKMFLKPRFWKIWSKKLPSAEERTEPFLFGCPFQKSDTTILKLPAGYIAEALPKTRELKCDLATYNTEYWYDAAQQAIYSTAKLELKHHIIPPEKYSSVKTFFDEIMKDDSQRIVIVKK